MRKILMGIVWFIAFFACSWMASGVVAALRVDSGGNSPQAADAAGAAAVWAFYYALPYCLAGSFVGAVAGSAMGWLPGTRKRTTKVKNAGQSQP